MMNMNNEKTEARAELERAIERAQHCADMARNAGDERIRRFHEAARDGFIARAVKLAMSL